MLKITKNLSNNYLFADFFNKITVIVLQDYESKFTYPRPGDAEYSMADINKAKKHLGYQHQYSFSEE